MNDNTFLTFALAMLMLLFILFFGDPSLMDAVIQYQMECRK